MFMKLILAFPSRQASSRILEDSGFKFFRRAYDLAVLL